MKIIKSLPLKLAVPTTVLVGFLIPLGYPLIILLPGTCMTLEHRLNYGKWWDRGKLICHGRAGVLLIMTGVCVAIVSIL